MKVLIVQGSQRQNGNTWQIAELLSSQLKTAAQKQGAALEVEVLSLARLRIEPCRGCRVCFERGEQFCPLQDDMPLIRSKMRETDILVAAAPVYVDDINGITKNWIDRMAYACHRPEFAGKRAYLIVTVGISRTSHALRTLDTALRTWGFNIVGQTGLKMGALMPPEQTAARFSKSLALAASRLIDLPAGMQRFDPAFVSLLIFAVQQIGWRREDPASIDYQYWRGQGWLDSHCTYFVPHRANYFKLRLACGAGRIIALFMLPKDRTD